MTRPRSLARRPRRVLARMLGRERSGPPVVSVVVPVYNVERFLAECLDSVLAQEHDALEVIVVNDGSTDSSPEIVAAYAAEDSRIRVINQPNAGLGNARNTGVDAATGEFLTFVDSDDTVPLDAYRVMVESLVDSRSDLAVGQMVRTRGDEQEILLDWAQTIHAVERTGIRVTDYPRIVRDFYSPNKMYRTAFWKEHGFRFREGVLFEDQPLITQIYCRARTIDVLRTITYRWRNREDDTSLSSALHELAPVRARIEAVALTRDALADEPASVVAAWRRTLVDHYVPNYLRGCAAIGAAELDAAIELLRLVATTDDLLQMTDCKAQSRVICHAALAHGPAAVRAFLEKRGRQVMEFPVEWIEGRPTAVLPLFRDSAFPVPDALFVLSDEQLSLESWFTGAHWDGRDLLVRGRAFIEFVDASLASTTTLQLTSTQTGETRTFSTQPVPDTFVGPRSSHWHVDHSGADFEARVPVADLAEDIGGEDAWALSVTVTTGSGLVRTSEIRQPSHPALVGVPFRQRLDGQTVAGLVLGDDAALRLQVSTPAALLTDLSVVDEEVRLSVAGPTPLSVVVNDKPSGTGRVVVCERDADGTHRAQLAELPGTGHLSWQVGGQSARPLQVAPDLPVRVFSSAVEVSTPPPARAVLRTPRKHLLVTGVATTEGHLLLDLGAFPPGIPELTLSLSSSRTESRPCTVAVPADRTPITARLPLAHSAWGVEHELVLPRGEYRLQVVAPDGSTVPWRLSPAVDLPDLVSTSVMTCKLLRRNFTFRIRVARPLHPSETTRAAVQRRKQFWADRPEPPVDAVFFQCLRGDTASDAQLAIHEVLHRRHPELPLLWGVQDHTVWLPSGATPVLHRGEEWFRALHTSRWVCLNDVPPNEFTRQPGQAVVLTRHGHPVELDNGRPGDSGPAEVETLEIGQPRNDALVGDRAAHTRHEWRARLGISDATTVILYAPTGHDPVEDTPPGSTLLGELDPHDFMDSLGHGHTMLFRGQSENQRQRTRVADSAAVIDVTDHQDINDLILASDIGVFDHSSIRFDYSVTHRPMVFFVPDEAEPPANGPGDSHLSGTMPGPRVRTPEELKRAILDITHVAEEHADAYAEFVATVNPLDDGHAADRLVDIVFADLDSGKERS